MIVVVNVAKVVQYIKKMGDENLNNKSRVRRNASIYPNQLISNSKSVVVGESLMVNPLILKETVQLVMMPHVQDQYIRWLRSNLPVLFPESEELLQSEVPRGEECWEEYGWPTLERIFPTPSRVVFRRHDLGDNQQWLIFPHPDDLVVNNLLDIDNRPPVFRVHFSNEGQVLIILGFHPTPSALTLRDNDGIATLNFDSERHKKGLRWINCPNELRNWMMGLTSLRDQVGNNIDDWESFLDFEEREAKKKQWGARFIESIPPDESTFNWKYRISASEDVWVRMRRDRNKEIYFANPILSNDSLVWDPIDDSKIDYKMRKKIKGAQQRAGILLSVDRKPIVDKDGYLEGIIEIEAQDTGDILKDPLPPGWQGFLVNSIALTISQIKKQQKGLERLRDQESTHNQVHEWVFDITNARPGPRVPPPLKYDTLPNHPINEDQQMMVRKALAAPDISLCQGPPGGGKTTVIAEIIHQELQDGNRVLLASQTNLAVDNALGRLGRVPIVRPIRMFSRSASKNIDPEAEKFVEGMVVKEFFIPSIRETSKRSHEKDIRFLAYAEASRDAEHQLRSLKEQWQGRNTEFRSLDANCEKLKSELNNIIMEIQTHRKKLDEINTVVQIIADGSLDIPVSAHDYLDELDEIISKVREFDGQRNLSEHIQKLAELCIIEQVPGGTLNSEVKELEEQIDAAVESKNYGYAQQLQNKLDSLESEFEGWSLWSRAINRSIKKILEENVVDIAHPPEVHDLLNNSTSTQAPPNLIEIISPISEWANDWLNLFSNNKPEFMEWMEERLSWIHNQFTSLQTSTEQVIQNNILEQKTIESKLESSRGELKNTDLSRTSLENEWNRILSTLPEELELKNRQIVGSRLDSIINKIQKWLVEHQEEIEKAQSWSSIRKAWLDALSDPNPAVLRDLESMYNELVNVIGVTTSFCGTWSWYQEYLSEPFDIVIIDEVSKATPPELVLAMLLAKRVLWVGDHKQLPPTFTHHKSRKKAAVDIAEEGISAQQVFSEDELDKFEDMVTTSLFKKMFKDAPDSIKHTLRKQYRMHRDIMQCINCFYDNELEAGFDEADEERLKAHGFTFRKKDNWGMLAEGSELISPDNHVVWIDSCFDRHREYKAETQAGTSKSNEREILIIRKLLDDMQKQIHDEKQIIPESEWPDNPMLQHLDHDQKLPVGFISFYGAQIRLFRDLVLNGNWADVDEKWPDLKVKAATVDRFQGGERAVIIVSTVVSKPIPEDQQLAFENACRIDDNETLRKYSFAQGGIEPPTTGFIRRPERVNVGLSRAQNLLIIVGNRWGIEKVKVPIESNDGIVRDVKVYKKILDIINKKGGLLNGTDFC